MSYSFKIATKEEAEELLPMLFGILYSNMNSIAPTGCGYDEDYHEWYSNFLPRSKRSRAR